LKIYQEIDLVGRVRAVALVPQEGLRAPADHPLVGEVRGIGLVAGLEPVRDKTTRESFPPELNGGLMPQVLSATAD
jgi:4-aminobutyrate---pyruvate transaminase